MPRDERPPISFSVTRLEHSSCLTLQNPFERLKGDFRRKFFIMQQLTPPQLKKKLRESGFDVYRTLSDRVILAERIRDNLIMESGVAALIGAEFTIEVTISAQRSHFPGSDKLELQRQTDLMAQPFLKHGYEAFETLEEPLMDPSDPQRQLDTRCQLKLSKKVGEFTQLPAQLAQALVWQRSSTDEPLA